MYIKFTCKILKYIKAAYEYTNLNFMANIMLTNSWVNHKYTAVDYVGRYRNVLIENYDINYLHTYNCTHSEQ